ncbi:MAG: hypothetical protein AAGF49_14075, partial [Pseudomonadota bacterium]
MGIFELRAPDGTDVTPKSAKARAAVAMLLMSPEQKRSRRWLEARLWSDRGAEQASASLRQALVDIRQSFGASQDALAKNREFVALKPGAFRVDLLEDGYDPASGIEILEGLDARDNEFEAWLRELRASAVHMTPKRPRGDDTAPATDAQAPAPTHESEGANGAGPQNGTHAAAATGSAPVPVLAPAAPTPAPVRLFVRPDTTGTRYEKVLALGVLDQITQNVNEALSADLLCNLGSVEGPLTANAVELTSSAVQEGEAVHMLLRLRNAATGGQLWSRRVSLPMSRMLELDQVDFLQVADEAMDAVIRSMPQLRRQSGDVGRDGVDINTLFSEAVTEIFSFDQERMKGADVVLRRCLHQEPRAIFFAWRALLLAFMIIERHEREDDGLAAEAVRCVDEAMMRDMNNSFVLGIVSIVKQLLQDEFGEGMALASHAVSLNAGNAFGHVGSAIAQLRRGRPYDAMDAAVRARAIA